MPISAKTYERVALEDPAGLWELRCGELHRKPPMTFEHGFTISDLGYDLAEQLDRREFIVRTDPMRLRVVSGSYYIPDLCVLRREARSTIVVERRRQLEVYDEPMPLVVEVWSPSTGRRDREVKLAEYRARGDLEIWFLHPRDRTLTAWRRRADGGYDERTYTGGVVECASLPGVTIDLDQLLALT